MNKKRKKKMNENRKKKKNENRKKKKKMNEKRKKKKKKMNEKRKKSRVHFNAFALSLQSEMNKWRVRKNDEEEKPIESVARGMLAKSW